MISKHNILVYLSVCFFAIFVGFFTGVCTALCGHILLAITSFRGDFLAYCLILMPIVTCVLIWFRLTFLPSNVLGDVFQVCRMNRNVEHISFWYLPFIMVGTWSCHFVGGSVGREGVAMQIGASVADVFTKRLPAFYNDADFIRLRKVLLICGFASGFSGLFHVPFAAIIFAFELLIVADLFFYALIPTIIASFVANWVSILVRLPKFEVDFSTFIFPFFSVALVFKLVLLGIFFGFVGFCFSFLLKNLRFIFDKLLPNLLFRIFICSCFLAPLLGFVFSGRYTGLGTNLIEDVFFGSSPQIFWFDWVLKLLFTIGCLAAGFFGGEVTPLFAIGVCFGFWFAPLIGLPAILGAALGFVCVFASATNTWFAPMLIAWEIFGFDVFVLGIIVVSFAFFTNLDYSIYSSLYSAHGMKKRLYYFIFRHSN